jgi:hypothetical protein
MFQSRDKANGLLPALFRACCLLRGIMTLVAGATDKVRVEKQIRIVVAHAPLFKHQAGLPREGPPRYDKEGADGSSS